MLLVFGNKDATGGAASAGALSPDASLAFEYYKRWRFALFLEDAAPIE